MKKCPECGSRWINIIFGWKYVQYVCEVCGNSTTHFFKPKETK